MTTKAFSDYNGETREIIACWPMRKAEFEAKFPGVRGRKYDSFSYMVGPTAREHGSEVLPITRQIRYKSQPSLHKCNAKCMGGKCGGVCECQCGGKNHGIYNA